MDDKKKAALEANGWKVTTVAEFLGLTPDEEKQIEEMLRNRASQSAISTTDTSKKSEGT